ncbi:hypothetical protein [Actinomadura rubrisoli]|uniref:Uncharacterized protein n=1 Tax=Actinomadura rubrisoli TaxID=2530368 RepID=A0A4R5CH77_9ACTN|nr:hypothetical protein [Actinomadura rubrisoli]TDD97653.1 hypothetical protein E1298_01060 [Actinomadura rubrisoli]
MARLGRGQPNRPVVTRTSVKGPLPGTGTIQVNFTLTGTGTKHASGTGTIALGLALTGTGVKHAPGAGAVAIAFTLTGSGTKQTGIGLPPRPRTRWQLILGPASGGHELALTEATGRRYTARLTDASELAFSLDGRHSQAAAVEELATDVHVLWTSDAGDSRLLDRCRVGSTQDTLDDAKHTMSVGCLDYKAVLNRRRLYSDATLTYTASDQAEIAWALINYTQGLAGGALGIAKGWVGTTPTGVVRDRTYEVGDSVGERVQELSEVIDGFDWDVTPVSASALRLDVWSPQRGSDRGVVLEFGGIVAAATRDTNPADYANALRYTGAAGDDVAPGPTAQERQAGDIGSVLQGRWDAVFGDDGLTTQSALDDRADWQLAQSQVVRPVWTVTLRAGAWDGPDHIWLGDPVRLIVRSGRLAVDTTLRVFEVEIGLDGNGGESVQLALGGPRPDYRRRPSLVDRRLTNLERR